MKKKARRVRKSGFWKLFLNTLPAFFASVFPVIAMAAGAMGVFFGVRSALYADTFFRINHISIQPPLALPASERVQIESKLVGEHLLKVDLSDISQSLEKNPEIKSVACEKHFPSTLLLNIQKRTPAALVKISPKGKYAVVSDDGVILRLMSEQAPNLVLIDILESSPQDLKVGFQFKRKGFLQAMTFVKSYPLWPQAQQFPIRRVTIDTVGNISLYWENSPEIRLGRHPMERIASLHKITHLLEENESSKIAYIDLQYDSIIVKKRAKT